MHVPENLGSLPIILRDKDYENAKPGELLVDYTSYNLYYINKESEEQIELAEDIYRRIVEAKVENSKIVRMDTSNDADSIPVGSRTVNTWYMNIYKKEDKPSDE